MRFQRNEVVTQEQIDRAFNLGCDARLVGEPITWCQYDIGELRKYWKLGWRDVDKNWGKDSKGSVKPLSKIFKDC